MKKHKLTMEALTKLALVDNPANQHAAVTIAKRLEPNTGIRARFAGVVKSFLDTVAPPDVVLKDAETYGQARAVNSLWEKNSALTGAISSIMADDDMTDDERKSAIDAALSAFRDDLLSIDVGGVAKDAGMCSVCGDALGKNGQCTTNSDHVQKAAAKEDDKEDPPPPAAGGDKPKPKPSAGDSTMKRVAKSFTDIAQANAHVAELTEQIGKVEEQVETVTKERDAAVSSADPLAEITKGMSPAAAKFTRDQNDLVAKLFVERADAARGVRAKSITKGMTDAAGDGAAVHLMKCFDGVANEAERKSAEELVTKVFEQLAAVSKELEGYEIGGGGDAPADADARDDKIEKAAREIMKGDTKLTYPQAVQKVLAQNPGLYDDAESGADRTE